ncbi:hypothetical protein BCF11_1173 [Collimonas sp. PA-H2]|nr:hypothetical protein BCF11_1173 [Collimonas sp. PA-H2]
MTKDRVIFDDYNSTIAIGNMLLGQLIANYPIAPRTGVVYPSVRSRLASNTTTYNVAIEPPTFDQNYLITESIVYILTFENTHYQINPVNKGTVEENGEILWRFSYDEMKNRVEKGLWEDGFFNASIVKCAANL